MSTRRTGSVGAGFREVEPCRTKPAAYDGLVSDWDLGAWVSNRARSRLEVGVEGL